MTHTWADAADMHLNETSPQATLYHRDRLFSGWHAQFNMSKPYLLEKSPRHCIITRLLQYYFTPSRTFFVAVIKHPLATMRDLWERRQPDTWHFADCGEKAIVHCTSVMVVRYRCYVVYRAQSAAMAGSGHTPPAPRHCPPIRAVRARQHARC